MVEYCYDGCKIYVEHDPKKFCPQVNITELNTVYALSGYGLSDIMLYTYLEHDDDDEARRTLAMYYYSMAHEVEAVDIYDRG